MIERAFFLFPGQGAQYPGMALDLLEGGNAEIRRLFELASDISGLDVKALLSGSDAELLKRTDISQPLITLANLAAAAGLGEKDLKPSGCAGFSLGEYAALAAAEVVTTEDCFRLVTERGRAMRDAAGEIQGRAAAGRAPGMAAVIGLAPGEVEALISQWKREGACADLYAANFNSPRQTVVSGTAAALEEAAERFTGAGARRILPLAVAGPFHSPLMAAAAERFGPVLDKTEFRDPAVPLYSNVSGKKVASGKEAKEAALAQITSPVRWTDEEKAVQEAGGFEAALEAGPGKTRQGLWKDSGSSLPCYAAGTAAGIADLFS
jgi:[acyl-carrier-protein] S-malonyltransferase